MNELFEQWLDARLSVPGMVACGVTAPGMTGACRSTDASFSGEQMAQMLGLLYGTQPLPGTDAAVRWQTWVFTNGRIRSAIRPDGWIFVAAVRANSDAALILDPLTEEFLGLKPAGDGEVPAA
jgi:hypothetical protein